MPRVHTNLPGIKADTAWGALDLGDVEGASVRVHWTDRPYKWHTNDGREVFIVLSGTVEMAWREDGCEHLTTLRTGDAFLAEVGDAHIATPLGEARILVIERRGSV